MSTFNQRRELWLSASTVAQLWEVAKHRNPPVTATVVAEEMLDAALAAMPAYADLVARLAKAEAETRKGWRREQGMPVDEETL